MSTRSGKNKAARAGKARKISPAPLAGRRKWIFRLAALIGMPLVLFCGLELVLRLAGYGYATSFFEEVQVGNRDYLVNNEDFSRRFFPASLMRWPGPIMFEAKKPANTYRIFILGESAARGEPEPACAASRYLEGLLEDRFPNTHFEVINLGITAIDSHVILPIARDCARANGDLWIIYMGNNEMVGPFGAATVFGAQSPPVGLVRLDLALQQLRLGQLLVNLESRFLKKDSNTSWGGMKMFAGNELAPRDARKEIVYRNFEHNLEDIVRAGLGSGAKILLNTVAVNLKDCAPFASLANTNLAAADAAGFQTLFADGCRAQEKKDFAGAAEKFDAAAKTDAEFAELQFRWSECLLQAGNLSAAREHFQRACDDDALPFRADSRINGIIQSVGKRYDGKLTLLDASTELSAQTTNGICGQETFYEHVHFNFEGNFWLGRVWAAQVERLLPATILAGETTNGWATQEACDQRLGFADGNRCAVLNTIIQRLGRPPLSGQLDNAERVRAMQERAQTLCPQMNAAATRGATEIYLKAIERTPGDFLLHKNFAEFLESIGDLPQAVEQWKQVCELLPYNCEGFYELGRLYSEAGKWDAAEGPLKKAVFLRAPLAEGWYELGIASFGKGQFEAACGNFARAAELDPLEANYFAMQGRALSKLQRHDAAIQRYRQALEIQSDSARVWLALGDELAAVNQFSEAKDAYAEIVRLKPDDALAHLNLGVMLARLGQAEEARTQFKETLRIEPGNRAAQEYLNRIQGSEGDATKHAMPLIRAF